MTTTRPHDHHRTILEAGQCPACRAWNIAWLSDATYGFVLRFVDPGVESIAIVRSYAPDMAVEAAWTTGCNPGGHVGIIGPIPIETIERAGVPLFQLIAEPGATAAVDALQAAAVH